MFWKGPVKRLQSGFFSGRITWGFFEKPKHAMSRSQQGRPQVSEFTSSRDTHLGLLGDFFGFPLPSGPYSFAWKIHR